MILHLFQQISVIRMMGIDNGKQCAMEPHLQLKDLFLSAVFKPGLLAQQARA